MRSPLPASWSAPIWARRGIRPRSAPGHDWRRLSMALTATIYHFDIRLSDVDRGVYETLELKLARHPSESDEYMVTRLLAYCLEYAEGIGFSRGLSNPEEPPIAVRDLTG